MSAVYTTYASVRDFPGSGVHRRGVSNDGPILDPLLYFGGIFGKVPSKIREHLLLYASLDEHGQFSLSDGEVEAVKHFLRELLNLPGYLPLDLFSDKGGSALHATPFGELALEGYLSLRRPGGAVETVLIECNLTRGTVFIDERPVAHDKIPHVLQDLETEFQRPSSLHEALRRASGRAQAPLFKGRCGADTLVITTSGRTKPFYHAYVGTASRMIPVSIAHDTVMSVEFGLLMQGATLEQPKLTILIPSAAAVGKIKPSFNGKPVEPEPFHLNGASIEVP
jgi:hypothetical protein